MINKNFCFYLAKEAAFDALLVFPPPNIASEIHPISSIKETVEIKSSQKKNPKK